MIQERYVGVDEWKQAAVMGNDPDGHTGNISKVPAKYLLFKKNEGNEYDRRNHAGHANIKENKPFILFIFLLKDVLVVDLIGDVYIFLRRLCRDEVIRRGITYIH